jgi:LPS export ABC transporter protein LptC
VSGPRATAARPTPLRKLLALAAVCLGVAGCDERGATPTVGQGPRLPPDSDQVMFGIKTILTNAGVRMAELKADTAYFFDDNSRIELRTVHLTFYTESGVRSSVLTSREGTYNMRSSLMEARRDVLVVSDDGRRLATPQLRYDEARNEISSDSAFVLTEPGRRIEGVGFVSDPNMRNIRGTITGGEGPIDLSNPTRPVAPPPLRPAPRDTQRADTLRADTLRADTLRAEGRP